MSVPPCDRGMSARRQDIRNIAIIAHVDHGKTTLVDAMLRQSHIFRENQQVAERVMDMVDGVLLLVDAVDGPMPQTKFVLRQALRRGHRAIVVVNKIDRPNARPMHTLNETFDLFLDLGASEEQAEFATVYTNAIIGAASADHRHVGATLEPLFDAIVERIPAPDVDADAPAQLLVTTTSYDDYKGRMAVGRLQSGVLRRAQPVARIDHSGAVTPAKITQLFTFQGLAREEVDEVRAGDIVAVAGVADVAIGDTIADAADPRPLPPIRVEEPTLHMAILIETLRREGYEFQVSRPEVIYHVVDAERQGRYEQLEAEGSQ